MKEIEAVVQNPFTEDTKALIVLLASSSKYSRNKITLIFCKLFQSSEMRKHYPAHFMKLVIKPKLYSDRTRKEPQPDSFLNSCKKHQI